MFMSEMCFIFPVCCASCVRVACIFYFNRSQQRLEQHWKLFPLFSLPLHCFKDSIKPLLLTAMLRIAQKCVLYFAYC